MLVNVAYTHACTINFYNNILHEHNIIMRSITCVHVFIHASWLIAHVPLFYLNIPYWLTIIEFLSFSLIVID